GEGGREGRGCKLGKGGTRGNTVGVNVCRDVPVERLYKGFGFTNILNRTVLGLRDRGGLRDQGGQVSFFQSAWTVFLPAFHVRHV
ncbi:hypothetical protein OGM63_02615, partial [Plectonema radiosum NIES-515]